MSPKTVHLFQDFFGYSGSLDFINDQFVDFYKKTGFDRDYVEYDQFGEHCHFNELSLLIHKHEISLHLLRSLTFSNNVLQLSV